MDYQTRLSNILNKPGNKTCADCNGRNPRWASISLGVFVCIRCCGIHRALGTHISKMKSTTLDKWTPEMLHIFESTDNDISNTYWESNLPRGNNKPVESSGSYAVETFLRDKYERKLWIGPGPDPVALSRQPRVQAAKPEKKEEKRNFSAGPIEADLLSDHSHTTKLDPYHQQHLSAPNLNPPVKTQAETNFLTPNLHFPSTATHQTGFQNGPVDLFPGGKSISSFTGQNAPNGGFVGQNAPNGGFLGQNVPNGGFVGQNAPNNSSLAGKITPNTGFVGQNAPNGGFVGQNVPNGGFVGQNAPHDSSLAGKITPYTGFVGQNAPNIGLFVATNVPNGGFAGQNASNGGLVGQHAPNGGFVGQNAPNERFVGQNAPNGGFVGGQNVGTPSFPQAIMSSGPPQGFSGYQGQPAPGYHSQSIQAQNLEAEKNMKINQVLSMYSSQPAPAPTGSAFKPLGAIAAQNFFSQPAPSHTYPTF